MKNTFTAKNIAKMGIFTALAFIMTFFEFPIFPPPVNFLKLDFSNVFVLIGGFSLGTVPGIIILIAKEALCLLKTTTVVGQLANVVVGLFTVLPPFLIYEKRRSFLPALIGLLVGAVLGIVMSLPINRFVNYPAYMPGGAPFVLTEESINLFKQTWHFILIFNSIKAISVVILTLLLYKRVKFLIKF